MNIGGRLGVGNVIEGNIELLALDIRSEMKTLDGPGAKCTHVISVTVISAF